MHSNLSRIFYYYSIFSWKNLFEFYTCSFCHSFCSVYFYFFLHATKLSVKCTCKHKWILKNLLNSYSSFLGQHHMSAAVRKPTFIHCKQCGLIICSILIYFQQLSMRRLIWVYTVTHQPTTMAGMINSECPDQRSPFQGDDWFGSTLFVLS